MSASELKYSAQSPTKFSVSSSKAQESLSKTPPPWAEDQKSLFEKLVQHVEALKKEVHELRMNISNSNVTSQHWAPEGFGAGTATDRFHLAQSYYDPQTVSTTAHPGYYAQSPAYNPQQLLRPVANVTPTKTSVYPVSRMTTQQHMYAMHTPPVQSAAMVGPASHFKSPATNILSPQPYVYFNNRLRTNTANPPLPGPGYFTKPAFGSQQTKSEASKIKPGKNSFVQPIPNEGSKSSPFTALLQTTPSSKFKINSNFKSNDGDFPFSSNQAGTPSSVGNECFLKLLTSDKNIPDQGKSSFENATDSRSMFRFGEKSFVNNFSDGTIQHQARSRTVFGQGDNVFNFQISRKKAFMPPDFDVPSKEEHNQSREFEAASDSVTEEDGPHFDPVVPLPEKIEVKTGEEEEEEMFCNKAILFRFDADSKEWKERGLGYVKILRHKISGKIRLLMRREQILKICANHYINADMKLKPLAASDKSYVWRAYDYADEMAKSEQLAIRFKTVEEATRFKTKFEEAQKLLQTIENSVDSQTKSEFNMSFLSSKPKHVSLDMQFGFKSGEWRCDTYPVKNNNFNVTCVSCQAPNPYSKSSREITTNDVKSTNTGANSGSMLASTFLFTKDTLNSKPTSSEQNTREQWICSICSTKNNMANKQCNKCHPSNLNNGKTFLPFTPKAPATGTPGRSFGSAVMKKAGQWHCDRCLVLNEPSAGKCVVCTVSNSSNSLQTSVQSALSASSFKFVTSETGPLKDFGSLFAMTEGQWDCSTCIVRNEASASKCVCCQTPKATSSGNATELPVQPSNFSFSKAQNGSLKAIFQKKGQWDCTVCLIRNNGSAMECAACKAHHPNLKSVTTSEAKSGFTFSLNASSESFEPPSTGFKCNLPGKDFKFSPSNDKPSISFKAPSTIEETNSRDFSFTIPFNPGSYKFGPTHSNLKDDEEKEASTHATGTLGDDTLVSVSSETELRSEEGKQSGEIVFGQTASTFSLAELSKISEGFVFVNTDPNFKGFSNAGEKLFAPINDKGLQANTSQQEGREELYKTEDSDDIDFKPIVQSPDKVDFVTVEENEIVLYSQRVKLFRFDAEIGQWKDQGIGILKILKNEVNGKLRMLIRQEQVLKVCANHLITTTMNLKPLSGSDRAWMWTANDFSDRHEKLVQLAAMFKTHKQAEDFKNKFEECQHLLLNIPFQTAHKLVDTERKAQLIKKAEEMKSLLIDLITFLTDQSEPGEDTNLNDSVDQITKMPDYTEASYEWDTFDMKAGALEGNLEDSVYASPLGNNTEKRNLFRFGETATGFNFSFQPSPSPGKSPTKIKQSRVSVGTDDEVYVMQEEKHNGQYFEPVVPLLDLIEITSGEENEETLFCHRAKLYRFDKGTNQWKERGIGDLKILQNYDNKSARIVMRGDQVFKLCANHCITPDVNLKPMKAGSKREWAWKAHDFVEDEGTVEYFAVRFKLQEVADLFKEVFEGAKVAQSKNCLLAPFSSRVTSPKASPCGKAAMAILEKTTRERTNPPSVTSTASETESNTSFTTDDLWGTLEGCAKPLNCLLPNMI